MTRVMTTVADAGRSCPYCRFPLKEGTAAERCDACNSLHHEDCWNDGAGCAVLGCSGAGMAAAAVAAGNPQPGWAVPAYQQGVPVAPALEVYPGYGPPAGHPPQVPPPPPQRSGNQTILILAVIIALIGIGTGVAVATGAFSNSEGTSPPNPLVTASGPESKTAPVGPTPVEEANDRRAILGVLGTYQTAYSHQDVQGLSGIFSPGITRHGLAAGGCRISRGRREVLNDYESQFQEGTGSYELVGLSEAQIELQGTTRASLHAHYNIEPGSQRGYVNFRFAELGEGWKISEVYATCE
jgi:hypothetical protein